MSQQQKSNTKLIDDDPKPTLYNQQFHSSSLVQLNNHSYPILKQNLSEK